MEYAVAAPECPSLAISGMHHRFPVRRIYTIGRNYADHAAETGLGRKSDNAPGISLKPPDSILESGSPLPYPSATQHLDPEVEMVIAIGREGKNIKPVKALDYVFAYAVGFDMIRRDIMKDCIKNEHSWDLCKSFSGASPIGLLNPVSKIGHPSHGEIGLEVNGETRQLGDISQLIWNPAEIISKLSGYCSIQPGDIIFTGTPKGPRAVNPGDELKGWIYSIGSLDITIV